MTEGSKINLLKILLNEENEQPGTETSEIVSTSTKDFKGGTRIGPQITYGNYMINIDLSDRNIYVYNSNGENIFYGRPVINGVNFMPEAITVDNEGNFYCLAYNSNETLDHRLIYLNNITEPDEDGNYVIKVKKSYALESMFAELDNAGLTGRFWFKLSKCPFDSRFMIIVDGNKYESGKYSTAFVQYHVNFDGENTYNYKLVRLTGQYAHTLGFYVSWTNNENDTVVSAVAASSSTIFHPGTVGNTTIQKIKTNFASGSSYSTSTLMTVTNMVSSSEGLADSCIYTDANTSYFLVQTKNNDKYKTILYKNVWIENPYSNTNTTIYEEIDSSERELTIFTAVNGQLFTGTCLYLDDSQVYDYRLRHILGNDATLFFLGTRSIKAIYFSVMNSYNLYDVNLTGFGALILYNVNGYNGASYFNDSSVTSDSSVLSVATTGLTSGVAFARDLYNKTRVGNVVNSIVQIPYSELNGKIITREDLYSKNKNLLSRDSKEITKNSYEELYINNTDSFKVYDNNIGSTYNQDSSNNIAAGIFNSFNNNYKITKYRINYEDETYVDKPIESITRTENEATIKMYIYLTKKAKNIQIYDDNFTAPFVTIDISNLSTEKIYQIVQKVKVE